jgi:Protein of unknown function (DUF998)
MNHQVTTVSAGRPSAPATATATLTSTAAQAGTVAPMATVTPTGTAAPTAAATATRALLACGAAAGPIYVVVAAVQGLTRTGFDLTRHDVSLLANGGLGWIQITNFLLAGLLTIACAVGLRRALRPGPGSRWAPVLLAGYGAGLMAAGIFRADPSNGFPPGTPAGRDVVMSWHAVLHIVSAGIGFSCLVAACFVLARRFGARGERGWAAYSRITGAAFLAGFAAVASGSGSPAVVLSFWVAVILAWTWVALVAARLMPAREKV